MMDYWKSGLLTGTVTYVCVAVVIRRWLAPWIWWLGRWLLCWARYAVLRSGLSDRSERSVDTHLRTSTCSCCGGIDFDGMVGRWAVVTGCTDGIGKEYAIQLADRGINMVLISRNLNKLQDVAKKIRERHVGNNIQIKIVVADLSSSGGTYSLSDAYDSVRKALAYLDVALLVNNAAMSYTRPERLLDMPPCCSGQNSSDPLRDIIECNALGLVAMCRIVMPLMMACVDDNDEFMVKGMRRERNDHDEQNMEDENLLNTNRGGVVINVASASAYLPSPMLAVYGATKAFVEKFSKDLASEYNNWKNGTSHMIAIRCLTTGFVATKMSRLRAGSSEWSFVPRPSVYARRSLRSLGCHCGCRLVRRLDRKSNDFIDKSNELGWLECVVSVLFDSPQSPCRLGMSEITTSGYLPHTLMIVGVNAVRWVMGETYISNAVRQFMNNGRLKIMHRDDEKKREAKDAMKKGK